MAFLEKVLAKLLRQTADKLDAGNSSMTEEELIESLNAMDQIANKDKIFGKAGACLYMGMSRATFDQNVRYGYIPRGTKRSGLKELIWTQTQLDIAKDKIRKSYNK